jgi:EEF1A lysine methyltransferase 2
MDVLDKSQYPSKKFDIAIDKGTYDAIALCPEHSKKKRYQYKEFLCNILIPNSLFIITSCNWTSTELIEFFTKENGNFFNKDFFHSQL